MNILPKHIYSDSIINNNLSNHNSANINIVNYYKYLNYFDSKYQKIIPILFATIIHLTLLLLFYKPQNGKINNPEIIINNLNLSGFKNINNQKIGSKFVSIKNDNNNQKVNNVTNNSLTNNQQNKQVSTIDQDYNNHSKNISQSSYLDNNQNNNSINSSGSEPIYDASYLNNPTPNYPEIALQNNIEGKVMLLVNVNVNGKVTDITIENSSGYKMLDNAAINSVRNWQFIPAKHNSVAVSGKVIVPIEFKIK
jgi:TonB family protein